MFGFKEAPFSTICLDTKNNALAKARSSVPQSQPSRNRHTRAHCTIIHFYGRSDIDVLIDVRCSFFETDLPRLGFS